MYDAFKGLKLKYEHKARVDNLVFRLHYKYTLMLFLIGAMLSTLYDVVGDKIICTIETARDDLKAVVNSYCYITGTYTVDKHHSPGVGVDVPHPGVGPFEEGDEVTYHTYYQWVPFVLIFQGALFYLPHYLWKMYERGLFKNIIQKLSVKDYLQNNLGNYFSRKDQFELLACYICNSIQNHKAWGLKFMAFEVLNVLITTFTIWYTNFFLGGEFFTYGLEVFRLTGMDPENRNDPMAEVFPQMGKCNFRLYGPSGTVETRDVMCLLPTNVANEKIYIVLWVWLMFMFVVGCAWLLYRLVSMLRFVREPIFKFRVVKLPRLHKSRNERRLAELEEFPNTTKAKDDDDEPEMATSDDVTILFNKFQRYSDFMLLCQLGDNMETALFSEFIRYLAWYSVSRKTPTKSGSLNDSGVHENEYDGGKKMPEDDEDEEEEQNELMKGKRAIE